MYLNFYKNIFKNIFFIYDLGTDMSTMYW